MGGCGGGGGWGDVGGGGGAVAVVVVAAAACGLSSQSSPCFGVNPGKLSLSSALDVCLKGGNWRFTNIFSP